MRSLSVVCIATSYVPGRFTEPESVTRRVPPDLPAPTPANHSGPFSNSVGSVEMVSTLFTMVGEPNRPTTAGNGGLSRGQPFLASSDSSTAVSSPQMYGPAPRTRYTFRSQSLPSSLFPQMPSAYAP